MFHHSALMVAALNGHEKTVDILLKTGANPTLKDTSGRTAILLAASNNHLAVITRLLNFGEKGDQIDFKGNGIWHLLAMSEFTNDSNQKDVESEKKVGDEFLVMKNLIAKDATLNSINNSGETPLMIAVKREEITKIKDLIALGASIEELSPEGLNALKIAENSGNEEIINLLK